MDAALRRRLWAYFHAVAPAYPHDVEPVLAALAAPWVRALPLPPHAWLLELGAGTGAAAKLAQQAGARPVALDFSAAMLRAARPLPAVCGDMHALPLPEAAFDAVLAMLAFNSTDPARAFAEAFRVLRPGGWLYIQEWGTTDALSELLDDTLAAYAVEAAPPALAAERLAQQACHPWDALETADDIAALLEATGFVAVSARVVTETIALTPAAFTRYKLAWPLRRTEVAALPPDARTLFLADLEENIQARAAPDGLLRWQPNLVRVSAGRPA